MLLKPVLFQTSLASFTSPRSQVVGAAAYWMRHSIKSLQHSLLTLGSALVIRMAEEGVHAMAGAKEGSLATASGSAAQLLRIAQEIGASEVLFNKTYEPWFVARDASVVTALSDAGIRATQCEGNVLYDPVSRSICAA